jgi:hypothetical protein
MPDRIPRQTGEVAEYRRRILAAPPESPTMPILTKDAIDALDALYPERSALDAYSEHAFLMFQGGQRSVVRKLIEAYNEAHKQPS